MDGMKEREGAFEKKYVLDEEIRFKADAHRNRMIGLWAADRLGKNGDAADAYAKDVVMTALKHGREDDVIAKIVADFTTANLPVDENELREKMAQLMQESLAHFQAS
ncbi:DUF1476 domain-containing protein [Bartonella sp. LJL80]